MTSPDYANVTEGAPRRDILESYSRSGHIANGERVVQYHLKEHGFIETALLCTLTEGNEDAGSQSRTVTSSAKLYYDGRLGLTNQVFL
jgi:hypothetical protein